MALGLLLPFVPSSPPYPQPPSPPPSPNPDPKPNLRPPPNGSPWRCAASRRVASIQAAIAAVSAVSPPLSSAGGGEATPPKNPILGGIANTRSWYQFYGDGFSIRVPPSFDDIMEPEDYNAGVTYYGDKAKPKTFAARFASSDRLEVLSVVMRPSNQLKITFLEAKDITDLGTLKEASKIFVPGGAKLYSARTIKVKDEEDIRTYYYYEFGIDTQHIALMATVNSGKAYIAGAAAPQMKWEDDGVKLRSAAVSLSVLRKEELGPTPAAQITRFIRRRGFRSSNKFSLEKLANLFSMIGKITCSLKLNPDNLKKSSNLAHIVKRQSK